MPTLSFVWRRKVKKKKKSKNKIPHVFVRKKIVSPELSSFRQRRQSTPSSSTHLTVFFLLLVLLLLPNKEDLFTSSIIWIKKTEEDKEGSHTTASLNNAPPMTPTTESAEDRPGGKNLRPFPSFSNIIFPFRRNCSSPDSHESRIFWWSLKRNGPGKWCWEGIGRRNGT